MRKRFLGIICLLYSIIIIYVKLSDKLKNFLAPTMQIYILLSIIPLLIMGLILCFNNNINYKFKISDIILLLPLIMLMLSGDGRLSMILANNRTSITKKEQTIENKSDVEEEKEKNVIRIEEYIEEDNYEELNSKTDYDFSNPYFDITDATYDGLANYITYIPGAKIYEGKTIRVKGFTLTEAPYIPSGYFAIGKYSISCCAADATFVGFISKYDIDKVKDNTWYEIEGILEPGKDKEGIDIMAVKVINIKEIDSSSEEQYVYPCYAYDDGLCTEMSKYDLQY